MAVRCKDCCGAQHQGNWMKNDGSCCTGAQTRGFITSPCLQLQKSKAEIRRLEERHLLCSSGMFYTHSYQGFGCKQGTSPCPAGGWEGSGELLLKEARGWWPSQAVQVRSVCRGFRLMRPSQSTLLLSNAACRLWSFTDTGTKSDVLKSN